MPIDLERQRKAKEYARIRHRLTAFDLVLTTGGLVLVLVTGLSAWLRDAVLLLSRDPWISTYLYFAAGLLASGALFLPVTYYSGFVLPHRYGLSTQTLRSWLTDGVKGLALALVLGGLVLEAIYFVLRAAPDTWWLYAAGLMLVLNVLLANLAPVLLYPIFIKFKPLEDQELVRRLMALAERARTRVRGVYTMVMSDRTTAANAAFMGLGNTKRIVLGDTLYEKYSHDEIETILAHELGHQVHNDITWGILIETGLNLLGFYLAHLVLTSGVHLLGLNGIADLAAMPLFALALSVYGFITMPLGNAYSRWRERRADEYALETTRNAPAFIGAMEKLANQNLAELDPEPWVEWLLYSHPSIGKRLALGRKFAGRS